MSAVVKAAEAAVAAARLNVEYTQIRAPIAGRASCAPTSRRATFIGVGDPVLTTLVAQDKGARLVRRQRAGCAMRGQFKGKAAPQVEMALADERAASRTQAASTSWTTASTRPPARSACARCSTTRSAVSCPGCTGYCAYGGSASKAVLTPDRAIGTDQTKRYVFVVGATRPRSSARCSWPLVGGGMRIIAGRPEGLGELVVVNGLQRVRPGAPVQAQVLAVTQASWSRRRRRAPRPRLRRPAES